MFIIKVGYGVTPRPYPIFFRICWLFSFLVFLLTFGKCRMLETFPRVFCFRKSCINENGDIHIALFPNPVGSTAKTSLPWHAILWMHSICSSLRVLWTKVWREAFKKLALFARLIRRHDGIHQLAGIFNGNHTATKVTNHGSVLSTLLFLDQSEKSPDSGLATDK